MRARHRLSKLLLRQGLLWPGKKTWSRAHHDWVARSPLVWARYRSAQRLVVLTLAWKRSVALRSVHPSFDHAAGRRQVSGGCEAGVGMGKGATEGP